MKNVAVTGASGFIGRYLLPKLIKKGFNARVLDVSGEEYPDGVSVFRGDLLSGKGIRKFIEGSDILIHLAGQVLLGKTSMEEGNVKTTENLISGVYKSKVKKIIFSSSVAVYGDSNGKVFNETDVCRPNTEYGASKFAAEKIITNWSKKTGRESVIFRFFSIYGPENKKGVIYNLCNDFIEKGEVTVFGNGQQKRDLVFVEDIARLLMKSIAGNLNGIYNVGSGKYYSVLQLISILEEVGGKKCKVNFKESENEKVDEISYSVTKLRSDFNWAPEIDIKEGIRRVYGYLSQR